MASKSCSKLNKCRPDLAKQTLDLLNNEASKNYVYDQKIAALLASVSGWSYADLDDFKRILSDSKQINLSEADFKEINATNDSMLIVATSQIIRTSDKKTIIVCFRGTEPMNPVNWGTDLNTEKVHYLDDEKNIKIHQGFLANFQAVWDGMEGVFAHLKKPSKITQESDEPEQSLSTSESDELEAIYFTGHSLGAAMAFLAGLYVSFDARQTGNYSMWRKVCGIYNYGQPMVISPKSADYCSSLIGDRLFRMVYYNDIVPHAPAVTMGLYAHIGHEYRFHPRHGWKKTKAGETVTQLILALPSIPFLLWDGAGGSIILPFSLFKSPWSLIDHLPTGYINTLHGIDGGDFRGLMALGRFIPGLVEEKVYSPIPKQYIQDDVADTAATAKTEFPTSAVTGDSVFRSNKYN